ncbi:MAG: hypothetical protein ACEQR4_05010 [Rhodoluna sp.]
MAFTSDLMRTKINAKYTSSSGVGAINLWYADKVQGAGNNWNTLAAFYRTWVTANVGAPAANAHLSDMAATYWSNVLL